MSFPQLSLTITMRNNTVSDMTGFHVCCMSMYGADVHMYDVYRPQNMTAGIRPHNTARQRPSKLLLAATNVSTHGNASNGGS